MEFASATKGTNVVEMGKALFSAIPNAIHSPPTIGADKMADLADMLDRLDVPCCKTLRHHTCLEEPPRTFLPYGKIFGAAFPSDVPSTPGAG